MAGKLHLAGVLRDDGVHARHLLEKRVGVLEAELAAETTRAERLERELGHAKRELAICRIELILEGEGYVDCDRAVRA
jgi:hypothetical protein